MKKITCLFLIVIWCFINFSSAQEATPKLKIYRTWVGLKSPSIEKVGILYEIRDSSILISNSLVLQDYRSNNYEIEILPISKVETIKVRKKNRIVRGVLIGSALGLATGIFIAKDIEDNHEDEPYLVATYYDLFESSSKIAIIPAFTIVGAGIGFLVGYIKVEIPINGNINKYHKGKAKLERFALRNQ